MAYEAAYNWVLRFLRSSREHGMQEFTISRGGRAYRETWAWFGVTSTCRFID